MARRAILAASSQAWRSLQACSASAIGDVIGRVGISTSAGASRHHQQQKQQHAPPLPPLPGAEHDGSGCNPTGPAAFVFDIDGVLIRGRHVLPAAKKAMQLVREGRQIARAVLLPSDPVSAAVAPTPFLPLHQNPLPPHNTSSRAPASGRRPSSF